MVATDPPRTGYAIHALQIDCLKNLKGLDEISFEAKPITGIFGPNCCGKSTILHALACCYQPPAGSGRVNYNFSYFFLPNSDALWDGSKITLTHSFRFGTANFDHRPTDYVKKTLQWAPRRDRKPARHVVYIGVSSCVPQIELEKHEKRVNYITTTRGDDVAKQVLKALAIIFNRDYAELNEHLAGNKKYRGLKESGIRYSTLSMGAGEQRLLNVLEEVFSSPKYGLILIDELDLLLHGDALDRFLRVIHNRAQSKMLQVVFTSHRERLLEFEDLINIRHIHNENGKTRCLNESKPDALRRMTGKQHRPLEILIEDDLATAIVNKVAGGLGMKKYVETIRFGAAMNSFTVLAGMIIKGDDLSNSLCVLDGDKYRSSDQKEMQIKKVLTGDHEQDRERRTKALSTMVDFGLPEGEKPEKFIYGLIVGLDMTYLDEEAKELIGLAKEIHVPPDRHDYVDQLIERLGYNKREGLRMIMDLAATSEHWNDYVMPVKEWLKEKKPEVTEGEAPCHPVQGQTYE